MYIIHCKSNKWETRKNINWWGRTPKLCEHFVCWEITRQHSWIRVSFLKYGHMDKSRHSIINCQWSIAPAMEDLTLEAMLDVSGQSSSTPWKVQHWILDTLQEFWILASFNFPCSMRIEFKIKKLLILLI